MSNSQKHIRPTILAIMSGKGGVGKTMLAVAAARELSLSVSTMILDLDFFNRGLSGLLLRGSHGESVVPPEFYHGPTDKGWFVRKVANNLYTIAFPDVPEPTISMEGGMTVGTIGEQLDGWIQDLCSRTGCQTVILDCHGGPDPLSFAAAIVADEVLLVSEPDRITMYGTLHFLRRLKELSIGTSNVHLVFNKVVDSFTSRFLLETYDNKLRQFFSDKPLLAAFPLEVNLTKRFEHSPFVTDDFPKSMLARKTQVMLADLLSKSRNDLLSEKVRSIPRLFALYWRRTLGRMPKLLQIDFVMRLSLVVILVMSGAYLVEKLFRPNTISATLFIPVLLAVPIWATFTTLLSWTRRVDDVLILSSRKNRWMEFVGYLLILVVLWGAPMGFLSFLLSDLPWSDPAFSFIGYMWYIVLCIVFVVWGSIIFDAYRDMKYTSFRVEPLLRTVVGAAVLVGSVAIANGTYFFHPGRKPKSRVATCI